MAYGDADVRRIDDWQAVSDALLRQDKETLTQAARRAIRRSERFRMVNLRTQIANMVVGTTGENAWQRIHAAAELWRNR